jgi:predicted esterase
MKRYEISYRSFNATDGSKVLTALVLEPDAIGSRTGAMLFTHGWGGNRFQHEDKMAYAAENFDLVSVSVEFRQSGYDADPVRGSGWTCPYDAGFLQVFDVLNGLRTVLELRPGLNRRRLFHFGGSQGGHIALMSALFAPQTFAFIHALYPVVHLNDRAHQAWAVRDFSPRELALRDVVAKADLIRCPVYLVHGTADTVVDCDRHTRVLEARLRALDRPVTARYYEGGGHDLQPATTSFEAFKAMAADPMRDLTTDGKDDFLKKRRVEIPCGNDRLLIDWSKAPTEDGLWSWQAR